MSEGIPELFDLKGGRKEKRHIFTVTEITHEIKGLLEKSFSGVWVEGEVSNLRPSSSGHLYFSLKDENSVIQAVIFSRSSREIKFKIEDGLKVICFGDIDVYPPRGQYQLIIQSVEPKGIGALQLALEQLKAKLEKEGLFAVEHKRPIPYLPSKIAVVTSLSGAAIKDVLKVLDRRFKDVHIIINPAQVQGEGAKEEIAQAITDLNIYNDGLPGSERIEVMIVGRGGGSIEDLWAFNEEIVARAIYNSRIPVISAVGHERDWTISDLVADQRAATPSVAAELVIPQKEELKGKLSSLVRTLNNAFRDAELYFQSEISDLMHRLKLSVEHILELDSRGFQGLYAKLIRTNPAILIPQYIDKLSDLAKQVYVTAGHFVKVKESDFSVAAEKLSSLNPLNILARGYSVTFKMPQETIVKDSSSLKSGDVIKTKVYKGEIISKVTEAG